MIHTCNGGMLVLKGIFLLVNFIIKKVFLSNPVSNFLATYHFITPA